MAIAVGLAAIRSLDSVLVSFWADPLALAGALLFASEAFSAWPEACAAVDSLPEAPCCVLLADDVGCALLDDDACCELPDAPCDALALGCAGGVLAAGLRDSVAGLACWLPKILAKLWPFALATLEAGALAGCAEIRLTTDVVCGAFMALPVTPCVVDDGIGAWTFRR